MRRWTTLATPIRLALAAVALAVVLPVAWYLGSPLFITTTIDEEFPEAAQAAPVGEAPSPIPVTATPPPTAAPSPPTATTAPQPTATIVAPSSTSSPTAAPTRPTEARLPPTATPRPPAVAVVQPTAPPVPPTAAPAQPGPTPLLRGQFTVIDALHRAEGTATIYRLADGQRVLRFESFKSANGPGLFVYLAGHPRPRSGGEFRDSGAFELAPLKATSGNQNYALPPHLDLAAFRSAVIYCKPFSVVFSTAELRPV
jgi:hypothetical protein